MTDRIARRPHGRKARETYASPTSHDFAWPPVLEALALGRDDRLLDVGCGGGVFLRHVRDGVGCEVVGVDHSRDMVRIAAPYAALGSADALPFRDGEFTAVSSIVCATRLGYGASVPSGASLERHLPHRRSLSARVTRARSAEARLALREEWAQLLFAR